MLQQQTGSLGISFDATQYNPEQGTGQLPVGKHLVQITGGEMKATKAQDGGYFQLKLQIIGESQFAGSRGVMNLNLYNKSQKACEIAHDRLCAICYCIGVMKVDNVAQLQGKPFMVQVQTQQNDPQYTEVTRVFDANGDEPRRGGQPAPATQQPQAPQQAAAAPQWAGQVVSQPAAPPAPPQGPPAGFSPQPQAPAQAPPPQQPAQQQWQQPASQPQASPAPAGPPAAPQWQQPQAPPATAPVWQQPGAAPATTPTPWPTA